MPRNDLNTSVTVCAYLFQLKISQNAFDVTDTSLKLSALFMQYPG